MGLLDATATRNDYTLGVYALLAESLLGPRWSDRGLSRSAADLKHAWQVTARRAGRSVPQPLAARACGCAAGPPGHWARRRHRCICCTRPSIRARDWKRATSCAGAP